MKITPRNFGVNHKFLERVIFYMYVLNETEKSVLKKIVKNARMDFFRKNKYVFVEESLEDKMLLSNESSILSYEEDFEPEVGIDNFGEIFENEKICKMIRALPYDERSMLYYFYEKNKTDKELAKENNIEYEAQKTRRRRIIAKIKKGVDKDVQ